MKLLIFWLVCTAAYYLVARADVSRPLWSRLDGVRFVGALLRCAACSGTWLGALASLVWPLYPHGHGPWGCVESLVTHACAGLVLTAVGWAVLKFSLAFGGVAPEAEAEAEADPPVPTEPPDAA